MGASRIHEQAQVDPTARLIGPVVVGPGSIIAGGALVSGPTSIGADCEIGRGAVLSRSILWDRCTVGDRALVDHCILTNDAWVGPREELRNSLGADARSRLAALWNSARALTESHCGGASHD
jgi:mannose-1-phosphate guanylyltransferase